MSEDRDAGMLVPEWKQPEPELTFTAQQRKRKLYAKKNPLRVMPRDKSQSVHTTPEAHNAILRVRPNAIEVGTIQGAGVVGGARWLGVALLIAPAMIFYLVVMILLLGGASWFALFVFASGVLFLLISLFFIRIGFFSPSDHPVLFNRRTREVHVIPLKWPDFFRFWKKGESGVLRSYRWEDVQVRTYRRLDVPGGTVARTETAMQLLCMTQEQPTQVDLMVDLGVTGTWRDDTQVRLWEHIRRYMEEGGPPLNPGDTLRKTNYDKLPDFPPGIVADAGGPPLAEAELAKWTEAKT